MRNRNSIYKSTVGQISDQLNEKKEVKKLNSINEGVKTQAYKNKDKALLGIIIGGVVIAGLVFFYK